MNGTGNLLRKSIEFLWRHPVVLLPVFVARTLDFLTYWISGLLKGPAMKAVAPRSVLGGLSGKINAPVLFLGAFLTFLPLLCEVALFIYAMIVSGRWAHAIREKEDGSDAYAENTDVRGWDAHASDIARVATITLGVGAVTAVVGLYFTLRGGVPVRWSYTVTWCFLLMASWFLLPFWLRLLAKVQGVRFRDPARVPPFIAVALGFVGFAACVFLGGDVQHNLEVAHRIHGSVVPFAVNLLAAWLSAVPLTFAFVAMSRYVADRPGWVEE